MAVHGRYATVSPPPFKQLAFPFKNPGSATVDMDLTQNPNFPTDIFDNLERMFYDRMSFLTPISRIFELNI